MWNFFDENLKITDDETQPNDKLSLEYFGFGLNRMFQLISPKFEMYFSAPSDINQNGVDNTGQLRYEKIEVFRSHPMEIYFFQARDITDKTVACVVSLKILILNKTQASLNISLKGDSGGGAIADVKGKKTIIGVLSQSQFIFK